MKGNAKRNTKRIALELPTLRRGDSDCPANIIQVNDNHQFTLQFSLTGICLLFNVQFVEYCGCMGCNVVDFDSRAALFHNPDRISSVVKALLGDAKSVQEMLREVHSPRECILFKLCDSSCRQTDDCEIVGGVCSHLQDTRLGYMSIGTCSKGEDLLELLNDPHKGKTRRDALMSDLTQLDCMDDLRDAFDLPRRQPSDSEELPLSFLDLLKAWKDRYSIRISALGGNDVGIGTLCVMLKSSLDLTHRDVFMVGGLTSGELGLEWTNEQLNELYDRHVKRHDTGSFFNTRVEVTLMITEPPNVQDTINRERERSIQSRSVDEDGRRALDELQRAFLGVRLAPNGGTGFSHTVGSTLSQTPALDTRNEHALCQSSWWKDLVEHPNHASFKALIQWLSTQQMNIPHKVSLSSMANARGMDPIEFQSFVIAPIVAKCVFEAWSFPAKWSGMRGEWTRELKFLLHWFISSSSWTYPRRVANLDQGRVFGAADTDLFRIENLYLGAFVGIMSMFAASLSIGGELEPFTRCLTLAETARVGSTSNPRRVLGTIGKWSIHVNVCLGVSLFQVVSSAVFV